MNRIAYNKSKNGRNNVRRTRTQNSEQPKGDVYRMVTERIISRLLEKDIPWRKPWVFSADTDDQFVNYDSRKPYTSAINRMLLGRPGEHLTFGEIQKHKGTIKKGSKSCMVVFFKPFLPKDRKEEYDRLIQEGRTSEAEDLKIPVLRYYNVFHIDDVEGIESKSALHDCSPSESDTGYADAVRDNYLMKEGVRLECHDRCDEIAYDLDTDTVTIPNRDQFYLEEEYYNALFSGLVKSTAKKSRLNRESSLLKTEEKGIENVKEELTTEIGASMLLTKSGLDIPEATDNTDAVCQRWINAMQNDLRLIVYAASAAQKAARYVLGNYENIHA